MTMADKHVLHAYVKTSLVHNLQHSYKTYNSDTLRMLQPLTNWPINGINGACGLAHFDLFNIKKQQLNSDRYFYVQLDILEWFISNGIY